MEKRKSQPRKQYQHQQDKEEFSSEPGSEGGVSELQSLLEEERGSETPSPGIDSDGAIKRESNKPEHDSMDVERGRAA